MLYLVVFEFEPKSFLFETQQHTHKKKIGKKKIYALWESRNKGFPVYLLSLSAYLASPGGQRPSETTPLPSHVDQGEQVRQKREERGEI